MIQLLKVQALKKVGTEQGSEQGLNQYQFEYDSSDDFIRSNDGNSELEMESEYEDDGFVVSDEENLIDDGENDYIR